MYVDYDFEFYMDDYLDYLDYLDYIKDMEEEDYE